MSERPKIAVIVNPAAHKGGAARRWPRSRPSSSAVSAFRAALYRGAVTRRISPVGAGPGRAALRAVGGDGTVNETLNGLLESSGRLSEPDAVLCPVRPAPQRTLPRPRPSRPSGRAFDAAAGEATRAIDLLRVRCSGLDGQPVDRFVISSCRWARPPPSATGLAVALAEEAGEIAYLLMTPTVTLGIATATSPSPSTADKRHAPPVTRWSPTPRMRRRHEADARRKT